MYFTLTCDIVGILSVTYLPIGKMDEITKANDLYKNREFSKAIEHYDIAISLGVDIIRCQNNKAQCLISMVCSIKCHFLEGI